MMGESRGLIPEGGLTPPPQESAAAVLERARALGVGRFLVPGTTLADSAEAAGIAASHGDVLAAVGVHPHEAKDFDADRDGPVLEALAKSSEAAAIGEVGLDFHYDLSPRSTQVGVLEWMLELARRLDLPVILHNRQSGSEMLALLERLGPRENAGVFHSFTESAAFGRQVIDLGFRVSFSGMITFQSADNIREAAAGLPLDSLLVETDSPYLAPEPYRGKRCEPAFVIETAKRLAEVHRVDLERVAEATTTSFERLFRRRGAG
jgi:TatD DNase family protein